MIDRVGQELIDFIMESLQFSKLLRTIPNLSEYLSILPLFRVIEMGLP